MLWLLQNEPGDQILPVHGIFSIQPNHQARLNSLHFVYLVSLQSVALFIKELVDPVFEGIRIAVVPLHPHYVIQERISFNLKYTATRAD